MQRVNIESQITAAKTDKIFGYLLNYPGKCSNI